MVEHRNLVDVHAWRGPRGIGAAYFRLHKEKPETPEGMGMQPLCLMYRGPAWKDGAAQLNAHAAYIGGLQREGKVAMAGHAEGDSEMTGMVVYNRISDEEAQRLIGEDPAVKARLLRPEYHRWWCAEHVLPNAEVGGH